MKKLYLFLAAACFLSATSGSQSATITWDGDGGDFLWQTASNWDGDTVPGPADDVIINVPGVLTIGSSADVFIKSLSCSNNLWIVGGVFVVTANVSVLQGELRMFAGTGLSADGPGTSLIANGMTTIVGADFAVSGGATLSLPKLRNYTKDCVGANWTVTGSESVLDLPALTNISGLECNFPTIQVTSGGRLLATNLTTIGAGPLTFLVDGSGSLIDFSGLRDCAGNVNYRVDVTMGNGGIILAPALTTLHNVDLTVTSGVLSLPALQNFTKGCVGANWTVTGSESVLDLPALTNITGAPCTFPTIQVTAGGRLLAAALATITAGPLTFLADGNGSLIDFSGLQNCVGNQPYTINLDARNTGTIDLRSLTNTHQEALVLEVRNQGDMLFANQTFFITGTTIDIPPLAPILPPTLIFHGRVWHSYRIEKGDTLQPEAPWVFVARVPMTNQFLAVAPSLPSGTEFRATDFVADPPVLDLWEVGPGVQLVLYGATNKTYTVQSTNRLPEIAGDWPAIATVSMSNAFRIFPSTPPSKPQLFFKARE